MSAEDMLARNSEKPHSVDGQAAALCETGMQTSAALQDTPTDVQQAFVDPPDSAAAQSTPVSARTVTVHGKSMMGPPNADVRHSADFMLMKRMLVPMMLALRKARKHSRRMLCICSIRARRRRFAGSRDCESVINHGRLDDGGRDAGCGASAVRSYSTQTAPSRLPQVLGGRLSYSVLRAQLTW
jgi:hypothetical protein